MAVEMREIMEDRMLCVCKEFWRLGSIKQLIRRYLFEHSWELLEFKEPKEPDGGIAVMDSLIPNERARQYLKELLHRVPILSRNDLRNEFDHD